VVKYLDWATHYAQATLSAPNGYVALPDAAQAFARAKLMDVKANGVVLLTQKN
jgi:hypothetical protein